jgi:hypothetical protein
MKFRSLGRRCRVTSGSCAGEMVQSAKSLSAYFAHHSERQSYKASFPPPLPGVRTVRASEVTQ